MRKLLSITTCFATLAAGVALAQQTPQLDRAIGQALQGDADVVRQTTEAQTQHQFTPNDLNQTQSSRAMSQSQLASNHVYALRFDAWGREFICVNGQAVYFDNQSTAQRSNESASEGERYRAAYGSYDRETDQNTQSMRNSSSERTVTGQDSAVETESSSDSQDVKNPQRREQEKQSDAGLESSITSPDQQDTNELNSDTTDARTDAELQFDVQDESGNIDLESDVDASVDTNLNE